MSAARGEPEVSGLGLSQSDKEVGAMPRIVGCETDFVVVEVANTYLVVQNAITSHR